MKHRSILSLVIAATLGGSVTSQSLAAPLWQAKNIQEISKGATFNGYPVVPNRVLVKFKAGMSDAEADVGLEAIGMWRIKDYPRTGITVLGASPRRKSLQAQAGETAEKSLKAVIADLEASGLVAYAEPDYVRSMDGVPNDSKFAELWGLHNTGQNGGSEDADIDAVEAWDTYQGDEAIVVGVIDTGVDYNHPDLSANMWVNPDEIAGNNIDDDNSGYVDDIHGIDAANGDGDPMDDAEHGTHVSGTIGAVGDNGVGVAGVAWNVKIMGLKFLDSGGSGSTSDAIACLNYALTMKDRGVNLKLTSNSWGGGGFSQALKDAIDATGDAGMLFIAAAGNDGTDNDNSPHYPSNYDSANVISVASTTRNDARSSFSNYGATSVDLGAPGSSILSTVPGGGYASFNGTSMATPHVAGAAAVLWSKFPDDSRGEIKDLLMGAVDPLSDLASVTVSGGRLNLNNALNCDPANPSLSASLGEGFSLDQGRQAVVTASLLACTPVRAAVISVTFAYDESGLDPVTLELLDDGTGVDAEADDGIYSGEWTPGELGPVTASFTANDGTNLSVSGSVVLYVGYSHEPVSFEWEDITTGGTRLTLSDDDYVTDIPLPFTFEFYGVPRNSVSVGSNGLVYFANNDFGRTYGNDPIPSDATDNDFIAPFWDDLDPGSGGDVYVGTAPDGRFVIQFQDVPHFTGGGGSPYFLASNPGSFEVILDQSGDIVMQYKDVNFGNSSYNNGASATVGIQKDPGSGQQFSYNEASLSDESAIRWSQAETPPPAGSELYFSLRKDGSVGSLAVANEDIVHFDGTTNFSHHFDGSDVGLAGFRVNAFALLSDTEILMSVYPAGSVPGIDETEVEVGLTDILKFTATSLGENTEGTFEVIWRGTDYGLTQTDQQVDALELVGDSMLISTAKPITGGAMTSGDVDILEFTAGGTWQMYFDGGDVSLGGEGWDLKAVAIDSSGAIHLSMRENISVPGVEPRNEDVFRFIPTSLGTSTDGSYESTLVFDGSAYELDLNDISALDLP